MKVFSRLFANIFTSSKRINENVYREWDKQRARAMSPSELSEIDAIFARHV